MERPERLTKPKLRELLVNLGVELPKGKLLKHDLVTLYKQYELNQTAGYSSEEDADVSVVEGADQSFQVMQNVTIELERIDDKTIVEMLKKRGVNVGPITETTRLYYINKLRRLVDGEESMNNTNNVSHNDSHVVVADIRANDYSDEDDDDDDDIVVVHSNGAGDMPNGTSTTTTTTNQKVEIRQQEEEEEVVVVDESFTQSEVIVTSHETVITHRSHVAAAVPAAETTPKKEVAMTTRKRSTSSTVCTFLTRVFLFLLSTALLALLFIVVQIAMKNPERLSLLK